ncbi:hypothetical protein AYL99_11878 [Fonsecaea erecta]|uniref:Uncharacterized protein n=1 Tax=Fonsecaea erecta TaxID=1367422 RepID=A0A178Z360_9EURO|nr:hypothetical protein AYL99_11878 [Fonsecaea erecta]OAP53856.1 hypothetical protein AYL99_11878 [Fonsecaea erecta]
MVPRAVEEMNTGFVGILTSTVNLRHNEVVCGIMADVMCLIEIGMRYEESPKDSLDMVCLNVVSGRHMGIIKYLFEVTQMFVFTNENVSLHMCLSEQLYPVVTTVLTANRHVNMHMNVDWLILITRLTTARTKSNVAVMMGVSMEPSEILQVMSTMDVLVSILVSISNPVTMISISNAMRERRMVMETVLASDPDRVIARVRNAVIDTKSGKIRTLFRQEPECTARMVNAMTYMIRPMNLRRMCFDCRMMHMFSTMLLRILRNVDAAVTVDVGVDWSESFAENITIGLDEYDNPIYTIIILIVMSLSNDIMAALERLATVPVRVGERDSILINAGKLDDLVGVYEDLYTVTHTIWRNLPDPPDCERVHVIV